MLTVPQGPFEPCARIERPDLLTDERFTDAKARFVNRRECVAELRATFEARPLEHWKERLADFDGVWDVFQSALEVHDDPQVVANGYLPKVTDDQGNTYALAANPVQFDQQEPALRPAPTHGQHTDEVLLELGYDWDRIIALKESNAIM